MQKKTYLQESLRNGRLIRWCDNCMPLKVYIAPFRFYSKVGQEYKYREMVLRAFNEWEKASGGKFTYEVVTTLLNSQINLDWKRVDRQALGHCYFNMDTRGNLFSAEIQIGLSDGILHQEYMHEEEVYHTILHEVGHSLGLGHSKNEQDIMFTPHKYGVVSLSKGDKLSLNWLYRFPSGATPIEVAAKYGGQSSDIDVLITSLIQSNHPSEFEKVKNSLKMPAKDLVREQENIADLKKYQLSLQNIKISTEVRSHFKNQSNDLK